MLTGIFAGVMWALETVVLGIALAMSPFMSTEEAVLLAPFISTFLHDAFSAVYMLIYNALLVMAGLWLLRKKANA